MKLRRLGTSDVEVTPVALGAWAIGGWLWGGTDDEAAVAGVQKAIDLGMTTIDTAPVYGFGHSEDVVGQAIAGRQGEVRILTKFGLRWDLPPGEGVGHFDTQDLDGHPIRVSKYATADSVIAECEASLKRLGVDCIDLYQHHWPDPARPVEETMGACAKLLEQGKIRAVGVSNYTPEMMDEARKVVPLAASQPPYSMVRRGIEADVIPYCMAKGIGILAYSPLQNGILTGKVTMDRAFPDTDLRSRSPYYRPANRKAILAFLDTCVRPIAEAHDATLAQVVINWTMHRPGITCALVGVRNPEQAEDNAGAAAFTLTDDETRRINTALDALTLEL